MKTLLKIVIILVLSALIATALFFVNKDVIVSGWQDDIAEVAVITIPVFIVLSLLYLVNRAMFRTIKRIKKRKPSVKEGPEV